MKTLFLLALLVSVSAEAGVHLSSKGKTPNYLFENDSKALASSVQMVFRTGSMADPQGKEGLAMISFRSLLRGTQSRSKEEFFAALERLGATIDMDVGAGRTIVSLNSVSENLEPALALLAETVLHPALKGDEIEGVKEEAMAGLNQDLSNNRRILKRVFRQALFHGTNLAFPPEGTLAGVKGVGESDVKEFLSRQLKSGGMIFAVSSNHPEAKVKGWIEKVFADLPEGATPALVIPKPEKPIGRTVYVMDRKGSTTTEIAIGHLGITANNKDRDTLETGLYAFGEDMSSVLFQELREKKGWTYGAAAGFDLFERPRRYQGGFMVWAFPQAEHTEELVLRAMELYEEYAKNGIDAKKLEFSKKALGNSYPFKFATSRARLTARLYELLEGAPHHTVPQYRAFLSGVTRAKLLAAIQRNHDPANVAIVLVGDPARTEGLLKSMPKLKKVVKVTDPMAPMDNGVIQ